MPVRIGIDTIVGKRVMSSLERQHQSRTAVDPSRLTAVNRTLGETQNFPNNPVEFVGHTSLIC
jgi:hypothetical protein